MWFGVWSNRSVLVPRAYSWIVTQKNPPRRGKKTQNEKKKMTTCSNSSLKCHAPSAEREWAAHVFPPLYITSERGGIGADGQFMGGRQLFVLGIEYFITHKTCFEEWLSFLLFAANDVNKTGKYLKNGIHPVYIVQGIITWRMTTEIIHIYTVYTICYDERYSFSCENESIRRNNNTRLGGI